MRGQLQWLCSVSLRGLWPTGPDLQVSQWGQDELEGLVWCLLVCFHMVFWWIHHLPAKSTHLTTTHLTFEPIMISKLFLNQNIIIGETFCKSFSILALKWCHDHIICSKGEVIVKAGGFFMFGKRKCRFLYIFFVYSKTPLAMSLELGHN